MELAGFASRQEEFNIYQDVITQFPFLNGYTHLLRVFETPRATSRESIVTAIQAAFDELRSKIPWLGDQVVTVDAGPGSTGHTKSIPWPDSAQPHNVVRVDHDAVLPLLRSILSSGSLPPTHLFVPCPGLPHPHGLSPAPVLILSAVFIDGGVMVIISAHHNMIDGPGIMQLFDHLATLMNGGNLSDEAVQIANADRSRVIPLLRPSEPVKDYSHLLRPDPWPLGPPPPTVWRGFLVSRSALAKIKRRASTSTKTKAAFVSSDDALSAFCWQRLCTARLRSGRLRADQVSKFGRAVNGRRSVGLTDAYLGHMILHAVTRLSIRDVVQTPLAELAQTLRRDLDEARTEWSVRSCATFMAGFPDKTKLMYGGLFNPETDIGGTSLLAWGLKREPFRMGVLGESKMFRKPDGPSIPGCMYFFPSDNGGGDVQVVLCMPPEDLNSLERDVEWSRYVKRISLPSRL
ncbi:transferase family-domain-containing protein [Hypoxylon crocopeplum]|nr:transferase family-domain-containing protein [Hypoxylon crocopeplum]